MRIQRVVTCSAALLAAALAGTAGAWEPTKSVEFIIPAGTGGGADQMARFTQGVVAKHNLMKQSVVPINKSGGAGAEGFLDVKASKGDQHKIIITLSNLFTTPLATGVPFNWKDLTPVAMLALDNFVLWVPADTPFKAPKDYLEAVKKAGPNKFKMGGTGSKQEDQIITVAIEKASGIKFIYVPFKGGGEVATQLVGKHVDSTVNNPIEAVSWSGDCRWRMTMNRPRPGFAPSWSNWPSRPSSSRWARWWPTTATGWARVGPLTGPNPAISRFTSACSSASAAPWC